MGPRGGALAGAGGSGDRPVSGHPVRQRGLLLRSAGFGRTGGVEVTPSQCERAVTNSVVEVLTDPQGFGFLVDKTFCRITRVDAR